MKSIVTVVIAAVLLALYWIAFVHTGNPPPAPSEGEISQRPARAVCRRFKKRLAGRALEMARKVQTIRPGQRARELPRRERALEGRQDRSSVAGNHRRDQQARIR